MSTDTAAHPLLPLLEFILQVVHGARNITWDQVVDVATHAPQYYSIWWNNLFKESPQHVLIETSLIIFIVWLLFVRKTVDPKKSTAPEKLSNKEIDWLIDTWAPEPLVPPISEKEAAVADSMIIIDRVKPDGTLAVKGVKESVINAASFDFLSISRDPTIQDAVTGALDHYGVGSCGPRGFYGTIDQHLILEHDVAEFMGTQESICYSDGASTIASAIPAFAKKGDLLLVDEACAEPIMTGANLSRSTVRYFRHNDMADLRRLLQAIADEDVKLKRDSLQQRRFIIVEGIYRNVGDICPLDKVMELRKEFCYRVILDESLSFGVLGATGRGLTEHFNIPPMEVDVVTFTLDTVLSSVGGICVGTHEIVDHQRLSGAGYCFSASSAPYLCAAAIQALKVMRSNYSLLQQRLQENVHHLRSELATVPGMMLVSADATPVIHLAIRRDATTTTSSTATSPVTPVTPSRTTRRTSRLSAPANANGVMVTTAPEEDWRLLVDIASECVARGVAVVTNKFTLLNKSVADLPPTIMLTVTTSYTEQDMAKIVKVLTQAAK
eukprot:gene16892-12090_t